jgi:dihydrofolate reductase
MAAPRNDDVVYYVAVSLDGFIAGANDDISWLDPYPATDVNYDEFIAGIDGLVMGRRTYEIVRSFGDWPHGSRVDQPGLEELSRQIAGGDIGRG